MRHRSVQTLLVGVGLLAAASLLPGSVSFPVFPTRLLSTTINSVGQSRMVPLALTSIPSATNGAASMRLDDETNEGASLQSNPSNDPTMSQAKYHETKTSKKNQKVAILVCPAQFCVPDDYQGLFERLAPHINTNISSDRTLVSCTVAPLPRTEWIRVARQLPTAAFVQGQLPVEPTLRWYFDAIEAGLADIFATHGDDATVCLVGHSMGGWVARAYLGGQSRSSTAVYRRAVARVTSLVTLGTPHGAAPQALVDQTRGLLAAIEAAPKCAPQALVDAHRSAKRRLSNNNNDEDDDEMQITCVCSDAVTSRVWTTNVEELIATASYLPLTGQVQNVSGDGIVPLTLSHLPPPARRVVLSACSVTQQPIRHAHVIPTPWNLLNGYEASIPLDGDLFPSYVSEGVVAQWASYVR